MYSGSVFFVIFFIFGWLVGDSLFIYHSLAFSFAFFILYLFTSIFYDTNEEDQNYK